MKKLKKIALLFLAGLVVVLMVGSTLILFKNSGAAQVEVKTSTPFVTSIVKKVVAGGDISPRRQVALKSQLSGVVAQMYVKAGDYVKAGQLIAKIKLLPNSAQLNSARTELERANTDFENSRKEKERFEYLYQQDAVSEKEYSSYELAYENARTNLSSARHNVEIISKGFSAQSGIAPNEVRATIDGIVLDEPVKEGSFVIESNVFNEGTTIANIADMNDMVFSGKVEEGDVASLRIGMALEVTIRAEQSRVYKARLEFIAPKGEKIEGITKFDIRAAMLLDQGDFVRAGYSATTDIIINRKDSVLCIREGQLKFYNNKPYVEVEVAPEKFEQRYITIGISDELNREVVKGLKPQDRIKEPI